MDGYGIKIGIRWINYTNLITHLRFWIGKASHELNILRQQHIVFILHVTCFNYITYIHLVFWTSIINCHFIPFCRCNASIKKIKRSNMFLCEWLRFSFHGANQSGTIHLALVFNIFFLVDLGMFCHQSLTAFVKNICSLHGFTILRSASNWQNYEWRGVTGRFDTFFSNPKTTDLENMAVLQMVHAFGSTP